MPRSVTCHICGREFGTTSIVIHTKQCAKKWEDQERKKPAHQRRPVPQAPEVDPAGDLRTYNEAARQRWDEEALIPCPNCGRTFLPDRLEVHMRSCQPKDGAPRQQFSPPAPPSVPTPPAKVGIPAPMVRPKTVVCHICGREFGTASIDIHLPQCEKKWAAQEQQKPAQHRRPIPKAPEKPPEMSATEYNEASLQRWNDEALLPCPNCGRTFLPDRLEKHMKGCKSKDGSVQMPPTPAPPPAMKMPAPALPVSAAPAPRPKTVVCHICGREFGTASIDIHLPQCQKKWEAQEQHKPAAKRRPVPSAPEKPPDMNMHEYNEKAQEKWNTEALLPCHFCGRTFLPDRLEVHLRGCRGKSASGGAAPALPVAAPVPSASSILREERMAQAGPDSLPAPAAPAAPARPRTVVCHICGREFGTASIAIHVPKCEEKWKAQEAQKPAKQRRPVPTTPQVQPGMSKGEYNEAALQTWNDEALLPCPNCGRTFLPDRLEIHMRSCKPKDGAREVASGYPASTASIASTTASTESTRASTVCPPCQPAPMPRPRTVVCHICGREFGTASIDIHVPQCQKKWEESEARKPVAERRPVPRAPETSPGMDRGTYNEAALQKWNDEALLACPNCGRTFLPDRLEVHLRSCKPKDGAEQQTPTVSTPPPSARGAGNAALAPVVRPRKTVVCHICGREFGSASIDIHVPQCVRKWEAQEAKKLPEERRPVPSAPQRAAGMSQEAYNEAAAQTWNDEALVACENCGRTFLPDRLVVHLRSCRPREAKEEDPGG